MANRTKPKRDGPGQPDQQQFLDDCESLPQSVRPFYKAIFAAGVQGRTSIEVAVSMTIPPHRASPRFSMLLKRGLIHKCASYRDGARVHIASEFYDAERDGDESQRRKDYCDQLRTI